MKQNNDGLDCEKPNYWQKFRAYHSNSEMVKLFLKWLDKINKRKRKNER